MKLDISLKTEHKDIVTAVGWTPDCQLFSCSDDKLVCKWGADAEPAGKLNALSVFVTSISFFPPTGKQAADIFAISCTDGTFRFVTRSGREETKVSAHEGAVIKVRWSHDGAALLTAGEDGNVKVWSNRGVFRSSLTSTGQSVFALCWGPDDDQVVVAAGECIMIQTVQTKRKNLQWTAHEGIILCVDWNVANNCIVSGGEDCVYKVWDCFGRQLYSSRPLENVITAVGWSPSGESFAVGSYNMLRLCDKTGWAHCRERIKSGSILDIAWTSDGTQFAGAGGNGAVVFAQVVGRIIEWKNTEVTLLEPRKIRVQDIANESLEDLEFSRDRVVELGLGYDWLVVASTSQCFIYNIQNLNTPIIFDIRAPPHFMHLCKRHFLTVDLVSGIQIISFEGKVLSAPKFKGMRPEFISRDLVAVSADTVVVVDSVDDKIMQIFDATSGRQISKITHSAEVTSVALNQHLLGPQERMIAFTDKNRDLFLASLNCGPTAAGAVPVFPVVKLHSHVDSFMFNDETDVIVGLADGHLNVWYQPSVVFVDKDLLSNTMTTTDASDFGRNAKIVAYTGNRISIRKVDGSVLFSATPPDVALLYELVRGSRWEEATRLCRHQKSNTLWGSLASSALTKKQLDTVEIAFCELNEIAKAEYIQYVKAIPSEEGRQAELALYRRRADEAERILLQASPPLVYRAIKLNLRLFRWARALELATKHRSHVDTVLAYRSRFLTEFGKAETIKAFLQISGQVSFDWDTVNAKEQKEIEDEGNGGNRRSHK